MLALSLASVRASLSQSEKHNVHLPLSLFLRDVNLSMYIIDNSQEVRQSNFAQSTHASPSHWHFCSAIFLRTVFRAFASQLYSTDAQIYTM